MTLIVATCLVWWWVLASFLSRRNGALFFAFGAALVAAAVWLHRRRRRMLWLHRLWFASMLAAVAVLLIEAALHAHPALLSGRLANFAYSGYHVYRGGIYSVDPYMGTVLRPNVRRWMYWNGHWWWHESNAQGWRGPALERADVVFLGDSMIYGHGVQQEQTVPSAFARHTGLATANLGQQGTSAVQQLDLFRRRGRGLRPRAVFLCAHPSDLEDVKGLYEASEQRAFLARPDHLPRVRAELRPQRPWSPLWIWARYVQLPLWSGGILGSLARTLRERPAQEVTAARDPFLPTAAEIDDVLPALRRDAGEAEALALDVHRESIRRVRRECEGVGARLVLFDLGYPRSFSAATEALARDLDVEYSPAGRVALQRALQGEAVYLANDGHWSARGAEAVAEELARAAATQAIIGVR